MSPMISTGSFTVKLGADIVVCILAMLRCSSKYQRPVVRMSGLWYFSQEVCEGDELLRVKEIKAVCRKQIEGNDSSAGNYRYSVNT